jgi:hypothetical protein
VRVVLPAIRAELLHFETLSRRLFVFRARIVPVLAFLTLERDDFSWHTLPLERTARRRALCAIKLTVLPNPEFR